MEYEERVVAARLGQIRLLGIGGVGLIAFAIWKLVKLWQGEGDSGGWQAPAVLIAVGIACILIARYSLAKAKANG